MRANHAVTLGLCVGVAGLGGVAVLVAACGTDTFGTCNDTNTCGGGDGSVEAGEDGPGSDVVMGDTGPMGDSAVDSGRDVVTGDAPVTCDGGKVSCGGQCVNEMTDPDNCGTCGKVCPGPDSGAGAAVCSGGTCSVMCGGSMSQMCMGSCYALTDPNHCGSCDNTCAVPTNGMAMCGGSTPMCGISCDSGYHVCNGACDSDSDDPSVTGDPCVLTEAFGVFVAPAPQGSDAAGVTGSRAAPFATISHALANLGTTSRVYVCDGNYTDQVSVTAAVSIYGGLTCANAMWAYATGTTANVTSPVNAIPLSVSAPTGTVLVEDMAFTAPGATGTDVNGNGNSSIAALVNASTVNMVRVNLTAGGGANGAGGSSSGNNYTGGATAENGAGASSTPGSSAMGGVAMCSNGDLSTGGNGGTSGSGVTPGNPGTAGSSMPAAMTSTGLDGKAGTGGVNACMSNPDPGANGAARAAGAAATTYGTLSTSGWVPSSGESGGAGAPGQGGGGGGGTGTPAQGGNAGGAGGCGGAGGGGGLGGGASIALASVASTVTLTTSVLQAGQGGNGGQGGSGQVGQGGGSPGSDSIACNGALGGNGAGGSGGAGGTAGISVAILWSGSQPVTSGGTASAGNVGGAGGGGGPANGGTNPLGTGTSGAGGPGGNVGIAVATLMVP